MKSFILANNSITRSLTPNNNIYDLLWKANGNVKNLGWARMVTKFCETSSLTIKLFRDVSFYGKKPMSNITEGFVFNHLNCPAEILARTSRRFFIIEREKTENVANFSPAVLKVLSQNGVRVNNKLIPQYGSIILKTGDSIRLPNNTLMFQFFDDRDFNKKGVPDCILRKYHLAGSLGQGGQSSVRLLHRFDLNGKFAMKIISKDRFESESSFAHQKRLQHMLNEVRLALLFNFPYFNFSFFRSTLCENFIIPT